MGRRPFPRSILLVVLVLATTACGPIGPLAGGRLRGDPTPVPPSWANVAEIETYQLETRPDDPHSVNIWGAVVDGHFYIATSLILGTDVPAERDWVKNVADDPRVRLRADGAIYELVAVRVTDPAEAGPAKDALIDKYEVERDDHSEAAWIFRLDRRQ